MHGLGGGKSTWGNFKSIIESDERLKDYFVDHYEYKSSLLMYSLSFLGKQGDIYTLADGLKTHINQFLAEFNEVVLVGHSLGGLIIRQYLFNQSISNKKTKIKKIIFFSVPQNGSGLAKLASLINWRNRHLKQLCKNADFLKALNDGWARRKLNSSYDIKLIAGTDEEILDDETLKFNFNDYEIEAVPKKDHRSIVKPLNSDDLSFVIFKNFLLKEICIGSQKPDGALTIAEWADRDSISEFFPDSKRIDLIRDLQSILVKPQEVARIVGLSGLGKTRTAFESINGLSAEWGRKALYIDVATKESSNLVDLVNDWVSEGYAGILIIDNCSLELHDALAKAVTRPSSRISLLTLDYDLGRSSHGHSVELGRLDNEFISKMLSHKFSGLKNFDQIVEFAQGFPQLAVLIAKARVNEDPEVGRLTDDSLARRLLWGPGDKENLQDEKILMGCSLFNHFGLQAESSFEYKFIASQIIGVTEIELYDCVARFRERGLIDIRGRYAQVVPKPLAIRLAAQWWNRNPADFQNALISALPNSMVESFCQQIEKLDFLPEVKALTSNLCGVQGPFGQAEVILSDRGSRLFRSLAIVSPIVAASTLARVFQKLTISDIHEIKGETRRNLIWALERP